MKDKTESPTNTQNNTPSATMTELELLGLHEEGPSYVVFWNIVNRLTAQRKRTSNEDCCVNYELAQDCD